MDRFCHQHFFIEGHSLCRIWASNHPQKDTVVIFVHGLGGDAIDTWRDFPFLVDAMQDVYPCWRKSDLLFYGYESGEGQLQMHADNLRAFVRRVFPKPEIVLDMYGAPFRRLSDALLRLLPPREYRRLLLVGHSMGGVIIRMMARDIAADVASMHSPVADAELRILQEADLRLFAPALFGTRVKGLPGLLLHRGWGEMLGRFVCPGIYQCIEDLEDQELDQLRIDSEGFFVKDRNCSALTAGSLWGTREQFLKIGSSHKYMFDRQNQYAEGQDHLSVCKPTKWYQRPLEFANGSANVPQTHHA